MSRPLGVSPSSLCFAVLVLSAGCSDGATDPVVGPPSRIVQLSGNAQEGHVAARLGEPLVVRILDADDNPVSGETVSWTPSQNAGTAEPSSSETDGDGQAETFWILGTAAGTQTLSMNVQGGLSVEFTATALPGSPTTLEILSGDQQEAEVGNTLPDSIIIRVTDEYGNGVSGVSVGWSVTGGGGVVIPEVVETDGGNAATQWTLGTQVGDQEVRALVGGIGAVNFSATAIARAPISWICPDGDYWDVATCWDAGRIPEPADSVEISADGSYTVVIRSVVEVRSVVIANDSGSPTLRVGDAVGQSLTLATDGSLFVGPNAIVRSHMPISNGHIHIHGNFYHIGGALSRQEISISNGGSFIMDNNCCGKSLDTTTLEILDGMIIHRSGGTTKLLNSSIVVDTAGVIELQGTNDPTWLLYAETDSVPVVEMRGGIRFVVTDDSIRWGRLLLDQVELRFDDESWVDVIEERVPSSDEVFDFIKIRLDDFGRGVPVVGDPSNRATTYDMEINPATDVGLRMYRVP